MTIAVDLGRTETNQLMGTLTVHVYINKSGDANKKIISRLKIGIISLVYRHLKSIAYFAIFNVKFHFCSISLC